ncbi:MAG: hypothetical protein IK990_11970 [Ruminiclostridium sp.]|nr:hypothetical protein [Ruminiclostridium sp.]
MADATYTQGIQIEEANSVAGQMQTTNNNLDNKLKEILQIMENMQPKWSSPAADDTIAQFKTLNASFEQYKQKIDGYVSFIQNQVTDAYNQGEKVIQANLVQVKQDVTVG